MMKTRQNGFSLVELLVAIVISLVAMAAVTQMYGTTRQTARLQGMQSRLTEDGRFAMSMIQRIVYQAGFRQLPTTALIADPINVASNAITVKFTSDGANQIACDGSAPVAGTAIAPVIAASGSRLLCDAVDWVAPATSGIGNSSEVVDFSVMMGVDTGPASTPDDYGCGILSAGVKPRDCIADSYVSALGGVTPAQIVALKVCLLLRSEAIDSSVVKPAAVKNCAGADVANSQGDNKLYRVFRSTLVLKNR